MLLSGWAIFFSFPVAAGIAGFVLVRSRGRRRLAAAALAILGLVWFEFLSGPGARPGSLLLVMLPFIGPGFLVGAFVAWLYLPVKEAGAEGPPEVSSGMAGSEDRGQGRG